MYPSPLSIKAPRVTCLYVKVYTLECLILTKINLTHKSWFLIQLSAVYQFSYMGSYYGLTAGSEPVCLISGSCGKRKE